MPPPLLDGGTLPPLLAGGRESPPVRLLSLLLQEAAVAHWGKPKGSVGRSAAQRPVCGLAGLPPSRLPGPVALACWAAGVARSVAGATGRLLDFAIFFVLRSKRFLRSRVRSDE